MMVSVLRTMDREDAAPLIAESDPLSMTALLARYLGVWVLAYTGASVASRRWLQGAVPKKR